MPKPWHGSYARFLDALLAGQCKPLRLHDQTGQYEEWEHVIPVGGLYLSAVSTDPGLAQAAGGLGYGSWSRYAQGRCVVGADSSGWTAGTERGAETVTPNGTCSAPSFTGSSVASQSVSAGTPAGTVGAHTTAADSNTTGGTAKVTGGTHTFTGTAMAAHAHNVTAAGTVSAPTFTGQAMSVVQPSIAVYVWRRVG